MTPQQFVATWERAELSERSACQQHFLGLCEVLGQPKPAESDPTGAWYTFERGVTTTEDRSGWADVWMRDRFGWEYKRKRRNLADAYRQLLKYREDLENPPLLVVCDLDRFEVHTNFTGTAKRVHAFSLAELPDPENLAVLRAAFEDPGALRPEVTREQVTEQAAERFAELADGLRGRGVEPHAAAHFLMKLTFCMFAEDIRLLKDGLFSRTLKAGADGGAALSDRLRGLFSAMNAGGHFGADRLPWVNGGLFADADAPASVIDLTAAEARTLRAVNDLHWENVEPSVFGTLFERTLDPAKRRELGANYTGRHDIETLLEPVLFAPLRAEWGAVRASCDALAPKIAAEGRRLAKGRTKRAGASGGDNKYERAFAEAIDGFLERLSSVSVLDPACGSGNFLYVALHGLLDLEKEVVTYASRYVPRFPAVRPTQLAGLEKAPYAAELAGVVIWIGYLQWMHHNGFSPPNDPVLDTFESIRETDAVLDRSDPANPREPDWPEAEFVVGNPPFLGGKLLRRKLGGDYVDDLFAAYRGRLAGTSDLCCYWFEKARAHLAAGKAERAGLLATQGIRGVSNRGVLAKIQETDGIFWAIGDRPWVLDGANVRTSMVGFDAGPDPDSGERRAASGERRAASGERRAASDSRWHALPGDQPQSHHRARFDLRRQTEGPVAAVLHGRHEGRGLRPDRRRGPPTARPAEPPRPAQQRRARPLGQRRRHYRAPAVDVDRRLRHVAHRTRGPALRGPVPPGAGTCQAGPDRRRARAVRPPLVAAR